MLLGSHEVIGSLGEGISYNKFEGRGSF